MPGFYRQNVPYNLPVRDALALVFMVRPNRQSWTPAIVWSVVALASIVAGV